MPKLSIYPASGNIYSHHTPIVQFYSVEDVANMSH
jgi:hypothetical protein